MAFQHFILIATVFLSNRVTGLACPFHIKNESPYVTEESVSGTLKFLLKKILKRKF